MAVDILWSDVVGDKTVDSGGYIGDLLALARAHVKAAIDKGELTQGEAGQVYTAMIPAAMQNGIGFVMQEAITEEKVALTEEQTVLIVKQQATEVEKTALTEAQTGLAVRQTKGFDDDAKQKLLKQVLDSWSVAYSVAKDANSIPDTIKVNPIDSITKNAMDSLGIEVTNDPIGEV